MSRGKPTNLVRCWGVGTSSLELDDWEAWWLGSLSNDRAMDSAVTKELATWAHELKEQEGHFCLCQAPECTNRPYWP